MDTNEASSAIVYPNVASGHAPKAPGASIYGNPVNSSLFYGRVYVLHTNPALMGRISSIIVIKCSISGAAAQLVGGSSIHGPDEPMWAHTYNSTHTFSTTDRRSAQFLRAMAMMLISYRSELRGEERCEECWKDQQYHELNLSCAILLEIKLINSALKKNLVALIRILNLNNSHTEKKSGALIRILVDSTKIKLINSDTRKERSSNTIKELESLIGITAQIKLINNGARRGCSSNTHNQRASVLFLALLLREKNTLDF
ncbi:hypothetical protein EAG_03030 [Camponotus floridanus]|uniref:Uncharacterized protein n=1 Tax=Camponotus floridanus TaxID=104421 RepID=E2A538_CAMFO|nr:hypothetical protein EAG_03030 [Camponotus floridanus]